jgi:hypothetical protein
VLNLPNKILDLGRDKLIRNLLNIYNVKYSLLIYDLLTYSPMDTIIQILTAKFGLSKLIVLIIVGFLL